MQAVQAVRLFGYASDVVSGAGATLVVEGSHELVRRMVAAAPGHDAGGSAVLRKKLLAAPSLVPGAEPGGAGRPRAVTHTVFRGPARSPAGD